MTMNSSFARLWLWIFGIGYAVFVGLLLQTLFTPAPYGDLARIGRISDHDFGWRIDPPRVDPALLRGAPVEQADILVIGDSFSATHRWQSQLAKAGYSVATTYWQDIDETLCDDFDHWLEAGGFRGKLVIIESVERIVDFRLERSRACRQMKKPLVAKPEVPSPPLDHVPGFALNWEGQLYAGFLTQRCTRAAIAGKKRSGCDQQTRARRGRRLRAVQQPALRDGAVPGPGRGQPRTHGRARGAAAGLRPGARHGADPLDDGARQDHHLPQARAFAGLREGLRRRRAWS